MIRVSGLHRRNGTSRAKSFAPGREGDARRFREELRSHNYFTVFRNDVKERYREAAERRAAWKARCEFPRCNEPSHQRPAEQPFAVEGIEPFQLYSLGTKSGHRKGEHVASIKAETYEEAVESAQECAGRWTASHKGIVIYKPVALIRKITKPTTEIVELA